MVDDWLLEHLAKVTTLSCVVIIVYFLFYSIWRISQMPNYPWNWNEWQWPIGGRHAVEIDRKATEMPFTLSLDESSVEKLGQCTLTLNWLKDKEPPEVTVMWGAAAPYLMRLINLPWHEFNAELMIQELQPGEWQSLIDMSDDESNSSGASNVRDNANYFIIQRVQLEDMNETTGENVNISDTTLSESYTSRKFQLSPPINFDWSLLKNQFRYPAVIFITACSEGIFSSDEQIHAIVSEACGKQNGVVQIIHVKNELFPKASTTLAQYIKMKNGQSHFLQSLYVMDEHRADDSEEEDNTGAFTNNDLHSSHSQQSQPPPFKDILCSVCQVSPVTRVIIPCRHVCLCTQCFEKVETCPICRGHIAYYFKTRQDPPSSNETTGTNVSETTQSPNWWQRVERFNEHFSDAIGLIRQ